MPRSVPSSQAPSARSARWMEMFAQLREHPLVQRMQHSKHLPLVFSVMVVTSILYHYGTAWTPIWFLLTAVLQWLLFRLFDFVNKHHFEGGIAFCGVGLLTLLLAFSLISYGGEGKEISLSFGVWFFTPQSVITEFYGAYTLTLFLLFTFFIAAVTYYFSLVQYRVFMSFLVMCFPFTIYAKEGEVMPVPFIILLFAAYFALMIFCRQMHAGDPDVVRLYEQGRTHYLLSDDSETGKKKKNVHRKALPEIVDGKGIQAGGLFLAGACILILAVPKPTVNADRSYLEGLINLTAFTDYLMNAISGFSDKSDGGSYLPNQANRALFYAKANEPVNLRLSTYSSYDYETDSWSASRMDMPGQNKWKIYPLQSVLRGQITDATVDREIATTGAEWNPYDFYLLVLEACRADAEFAERWGLQTFLQETVSPDAYLRNVRLETVGFNSTVYLTANHTYALNSEKLSPENPVYQNDTGIFYRNSPTRLYNDVYSFWYVSDAFARSQPMQALLKALPDTSRTWSFMLELQAALIHEDSLSERLEGFEQAYSNVLMYRYNVDSQTPDSIQQLALELVEGLETDYDKALAIRNYLASKYTYSLEFPITDSDNVETFLFQNKTGVCYQFASAMTELCRAAGLNARYVEGYALSEGYSSLLNTDFNYVIRTNHAHAFTEVFLMGYGWMSFDATAASSTLPQEESDVDVLGTLQFTGMTLLVLAILALYVLTFLIPRLRERHFRRWCRRQMAHQPSLVVQQAFLRLRKQWARAESATARELCLEMADTLACDTSALLQGFEPAVYGNGCTPADAQRVYDSYCTLYQAWKTVRRRQKREASRAKRMAKRAAKATA